MRAMMKQQPKLNSLLSEDIGKPGITVAYTYFCVIRRQFFEVQCLSFEPHLLSSL